MKGKLTGLLFDPFTGKQTITLVIDGDFRKKYDDLKDKDLEIEMKPWKPKRSLNANAYMWVLIGKLAEAMNLPADEVYRLHIKQVGVWKDFPPLPKREAETLRIAWRGLGEGWIAEQLDYDEDGESVVVRCWYGSSVYNSKQMARLIDSVVQDCKAIGIETMKPAEISLLCDTWKGAKI